MVIVFDFDGVIVRNSEFIKQDAWRVVFGENKRISLVKELLVKYADGKGSRYNIIHDLLKEEGVTLHIDSLIDHYASIFNDVVKKGILSEGVILEDKEVLEDLSKFHKLYINSATPEDVLRVTVESLGIENFFTGVYGTPSTKVENLNQIAKLSDLDVCDLVFVGDSNGDYNAALEVGCSFIGFSNSWNGWDHSKNYRLITKLKELKELIDQLN